MRVAVYSRQSTPNDDQLEDHVRRCVERVERQDDTVVGPFKDDGISGYARKVRPGYEAMLAALAAGEADAIIAVRYDRLLRDPREGIRLSEVLDAADVTDLLFIEEADIDHGTAAGRSEVRKRADAATYYSDSLGEKVRGSKSRIAWDGRWCGAAPYGYDTVDDHPNRRDGVTLVENPAEADVIREALALVKAGDNVNKVAMKLRARGFTTGWGKSWTSKALRRALLSPAIAGLASLNGEVLRGDDGEPVPVQWQPIITSADHALLKERLAVGSVDRHPDGVNMRHPLAGILRCGLCGTQMYGATLGARSGKPGKSRYTCSTERGGCGKISVTSAFVEPETVTWALTGLLAEGRAPVAEGVAADVHAAAAAELSSIAADRAALNGAARLLPKATVAAALADLKKRERAAKASLARPVAVAFDPRAVAETIKARWDAYQAGDRDSAELLHDEVALVIDRITVAPIKPGSRKNVFDPDRLTIFPAPLGVTLAKAIGRKK